MAHHQLRRAGPADPVGGQGTHPVRRASGRHGRHLLAQPAGMDHRRLRDPQRGGGLRPHLSDQHRETGQVRRRRCRHLADLRRRAGPVRQGPWPSRRTPRSYLDRRVRHRHHPDRRALGAFRGPARQGAHPPWTTRSPHASMPESSTDVATIIYTSGTTGEPKGAMLTHANFAIQFRALDERFDVGPEDRSLCFLPLSHAYERAWSYYVFRSGCRNVYLRDPQGVVVAMPEVRPRHGERPAALREDLCRRPGPRGRSSPVPGACSTGRSASAAAIEHASRTGRRVGGRCSRRARARRSAGPVQDQGGRGRREEGLLGRRRSAGEGDRGVLLRRRTSSICQGYGLTETSPWSTCN